MDISQVASLPASTPSRTSGEAAPGYAQSSSPVSNPAPSTADASKTVDLRDAPSADRLAQAVKQVNDAFNQRGESLYASFEKDKITGLNIVKIVDKKTNETISQLPPKVMVEFAKTLELPQGWRGQLLHDKA